MIAQQAPAEAVIERQPLSFNAAEEVVAEQAARMEEVEVDDLGFDLNDDSKRPLLEDLEQTVR